MIPGQKYGFSRWYSAVALTLLISSTSWGQIAATKTSAKSSAAAPQNMEAALDAVRNKPLDLYDFLRRMPKGTDLHNHLSGAVYAESFIRAGAEDGLCVKPNYSFAQPAAPAQGNAAAPKCGTGDVPAKQAFSDQTLYDALVDAFSMRGFVPTSGVTGHDRFFDTFAKFGGTDSRHVGEWVDEVATRAAAQNEQYLELMQTPPFGHAIALSHQISWTDDFSELRDQLLAHGLRDEVKAATAQIDQAEALRREREHCGTANETPACRVEIRYVYQILRGNPKEQVFAQTLLGFETAAADPRFVGLNYVQPEDGYISMNDYALHMRIVGFLHQLYPTVHISLHAGELAPAMVPYEGLSFHIREAVDEAHAERIGHGVDVMYEDHPYDLLKEMASKHVMVEVNLTSNDVILGIAGKDHPFPIYRKFGVPVALSTDDEGVSRIDLTHEYVRAVQTYDLHYADLKQMVRTGMEHSFLPGASLWRTPDDFAHPATVCEKVMLGGDKPIKSCADLLNGSEKAREQWDLERRFKAFEASTFETRTDRLVQAQPKREVPLLAPSSGATQPPVPKN